MTSHRSSRVVVDGDVRPATVHVEGGVVVAIGEGAADNDYGNHVLLPGLVDSHVHVNEPGRTEWEGFTTATKAAAASGTTTIVDMPLNSIPPTTDVRALAIKSRAAMGKLWVDAAMWGGVVPGSEDSIPALTEAGVCGLKVFLTDSGVPEFPPMTVDALRGLKMTVPLLVHAEDSELLGSLRSPAGYRDYLESRPPQAERVAIEEVAHLSGEVHILHVSSADGVAAISAGPNGLSGETCPHYLTFDADDIDDHATVFKCAPPIRSREHREALWEGLADGSLAMVVSDHSPSPPGMKRGDFATAWGGISSLQLRLPVVWEGAIDRGIGFARLAEWLAAAPARLAGLVRKGSIGPGMDADFVVFDPEGSTEVRGADLLHRHPLTPYEGMTLRGSVVTTILGGHTIFDGRTVSGPRGRMLTRS